MLEPFVSGVRRRKETAHGAPERGPRPQGVCRVPERRHGDVERAVRRRHRLARSGPQPACRDLPGKDEVFASFQKVAELTGGTCKLDIHAVFADDEHAVVLAKATGEREGRKLDDNSVQVFHIFDGKVTEQWLHVGDAYASDEFWG
jgi:ketosteroid isomerase-like protein